MLWLRQAGLGRSGETNWCLYLWQPLPARCWDSRTDYSSQFHLASRQSAPSSKLFWVSFVMVQCNSIEFWEIVINFKICTEKIYIEMKHSQVSNARAWYTPRGTGAVTDWHIDSQPLRGSGLRQGISTSDFRHQSHSHRLNKRQWLCSLLSPHILHSII